MRLLFLGDSLVAFYDWQATFPIHTVINAGIAGETVAGLRADLPRHLHRCPNPDRVFIMIGTNNLLMEEYGFLPDYEKILDTLGGALPPAHITIASLLPMRLTHLSPSAIPRLNDGLLQLSGKKRTSFLDLFTAFNTAAADLDACFTEDGVHLSDLGYTIWANCLVRILI